MTRLHSTNTIVKWIRLMEVICYCSALSLMYQVLLLIEFQLIFEIDEGGPLEL
jgi:hypothetical protein